ncbi:winged helix-turn-helix transcriptional regulator, partial [Thiohalocapsa marina]
MIKDEHQYRLLRHLEQHPGASQRELAKLVGLSLSSTNDCLRAVIENTCSRPKAPRPSSGSSTRSSPKSARNT